MTSGTALSTEGLGKRPELLLLDEPMADLDPHARDVEGTSMFPWYDQGVFPASGPVLVAHGLLAVAVGAVASHFADYYPASYYWPLRLIESGVCLALAALALFTAFRILRARNG